MRRLTAGCVAARLLRSVLPAMLLVLLILAARPAAAGERLRLGLDWLAEAEYGGYYAAQAAGLYAQAGLDVQIEQGGPQVNQAQKLLAGRLDVTVTGNSFLALNFVQEKLPFVAIAAFFQKDPSIILAHPGVGHDSFAALRGKPVMIGADTRSGWWNFVRAKFGYSDDQIRPYTFNLAPFLADPQAVQQGYLGSEPFLVAQQGGFKPVVLLLADAGFSGYANLISTSRALAAAKPDVLRKFIAASIAGWKIYLHGDARAADALIKDANPEMSDALLAYGRGALRDHAIVEGPDGIGMMTAARWQGFYTSMRDAGLYPADLAWRDAFTLDFLPPQ